MCLSKYVKVKCKKCSIYFEKRKDTINIWKGMCFKCSCDRPKKIKISKPRPSGQNHYKWLGGRKKGNCVDCGIILSGIIAKRCRPCHFKTTIGRFVPKEVGDKISKTKRMCFGTKYPQSELRKKRREYKQWHDAVFKRDNSMCVQCGSINKLEAHHIKEVCNYPELIYNTDNGLTLCRECHKKTSNYGISFYNKITHKFR